MRERVTIMKWTEKHTLHHLKQTLAMMLVFALLISGSGGSLSALAGTLALPEKLESIGAETFCGDSSVESVYISDGTTEIGSRAFADSGVREVYIPASVTDIADDAFEGLDDVVIYAYADTPAFEYATERNLTCVDRANILNDGRESAIDMLNDEQLLNDSLLLDDQKLRTVSTAGITDPQVLADLAIYNQAVENYTAYLAEYNQLMNSFVEMNASDNLAYSELEDGSGYQIAGLTDSIDEELRGLDISGDDVREFGYDELTGTIIVTLTDGTVMHLDCSESGMSMTRDSSASKALAAYGARSIADNVVAVIQNSIEQVSYLFGMIDVLFDDADQNLTLAIAEVRIAIQQTTLASLDGYFDSHAVELSAEYRRLQNSLEKLRTWHKRFRALNLASSLKDVTLDYLPKIVRMQDIVLAHRHPTSIESQYPEVVDKCSEMNTFALQATGYYSALAIEKVVEIVKIVKSFLVAASAACGQLQITVAVQLSSALILEGAKMIIEWGLERMGMEAYDKALFIDECLHNCCQLSGKVTDSETRLPIENATVESGSYSVKTDANGRYQLNVYSFNMSLATVNVEFSAEEYRSVTRSISVKRNMTPIVNVSLEPDIRGTVQGVIIDYFTDKPVPGVTVSCEDVSVESDANGRYLIELEPGTRVVSYSKDKYLTSEESYTLEAEQVINKDIILHKETCQLSGTIRDLKDGTPLASARVLSLDCMELSDESGKYVIELPAGTQTIEYSLDGYKDKSVTLDLKAGSKILYNVNLEKNDLVLYGNATKLDENVIQLTPLDFHQFGSAWFQSGFNTQSGLTVSFDYLAGGGHDNWAGGADGIVFQFASEPSGGGGDGSNMGFKRGAVGVEMDSYFWEWDCDEGIEQKHIAIVKGTFSNHLAYQYDTRVDDGRWHNVLIKYASGTMNVYLDQSWVLSAKLTLPDTVYLGASATTGNGYNRHWIRNIVIS